MKFNEFIYKSYNDIFNYSKEIKLINKGYHLYFNKKLKRFEILNINNNYEQCFIFNTIFNFNLHNLRFLIIENLSEILKSIEEHNSILSEKQLCLSNEKMNYALKEFHKLSNRSNTLSTIDTNKIIGATKC